MDSGGQIGRAEVEVRANLDGLAADFQTARQQSMAFTNAAERDMGGARRAFQQTSGDVRELSNHFSTDLANGVSKGAKSFRELQAEYLSSIRSGRQAGAEIDRLSASLARMKQANRAGTGRHGAADMLNIQTTIDELAKLKNEFEASGGTAEEWEARMAEAGQRVGMTIRDITGKLVRGAVAFGAIATAALYAADRMLTSVASIGLLSRELSTSTDFIQEFRFAFEQMGGTADQADAVLGSLTERVREASREGKEADDIFAALGVSIHNSSGEIRPTEELYRDLADAIREIDDPARQAAVAQDIFGDSSGALLNLLDEGAQGFNALAEEAANLGIILDQELIDQADEAARNLDTVKGVVNAEMARAVSENAGAIVELAQAFSELIGFVAQATAGVARFLQYMGRLGGVAGRMSQQRGLDPRGDTIFGRLSVLYNPMMAVEAFAITNEINRRHPLGVGSTPSTGSGNFWGGGDSDDAAIDAALAGPSRTRRPRTRRPRTQRTPVDQAARSLARYLDQLDSFTNRQIAAESAITNDAEQRAELERRRIERSHAATRRDLESDERENRRRLEDYIARRDISAQQRAAAQGELDALQERRETLETINDNIRLDQMELVDLRERERIRSEALEIATSQLSNEADILDAQANLAETAQERRELELRILDLSMREEQARLQAVIASEETSETEKQIAQQRLATLDQLREFQVEAIERSNLTPGGKYLDDLTLSAEQAREAIEGITVDALVNLENNILDVIDGAKSLGAAFHDVALGIVQDLLRIAIQSQIIQPLAGALFGGGGQTGGPLGFLGDIFSTVAGGTVNAKVAHRGLGNGQSVSTRSVPSEIFVNAPRLHNGLAGDEFPAILQTGETVNPRGSRSGTTVNIGDIIVQGARTAREARQTGKQVAGEIRRQIASATKTGTAG